MRMKLLTFFILIYLFIFNVSYGKKELMINTNRNYDGTILISTVDGYIHAIDTLTGNKLWSFGNDDENNLAESYNYNYYKKNNDDNNEFEKSQEEIKLDELYNHFDIPINNDNDELNIIQPLNSNQQISSQYDNGIVIPSLNGDIYYITDKGLERLPISLKEMIHATPFRTEDSTKYIGHKDLTVFVIDRLSGKLLRILSSDGTVDANYCNKDQDFDSIWISKQQLSLNALNNISGSIKWNVTLNTYIPFYDAGLTDTEKEIKSNKYIDYPIIATTNGILTYLDLKNNNLKWSYQFKSNDNQDLSIAAVYYVEKLHSHNDLIKLPLLYIDVPILNPLHSYLDLIFKYYYQRLNQQNNQIFDDQNIKMHISDNNGQIFIVDSITYDLTTELYHQQQHNHDDPSDTSSSLGLVKFNDNRGIVKFNNCHIYIMITFQLV